MDSFDPRIRSLLRQAQRVAGTGKRAAAEKLYRQLLDEAPEAAPAWAGLAGVLRDPAEREAAYQRALALDPDNEEALAGLASLSGADGAEMETAPEPALAGATASAEDPPAQPAAPGDEALHDHEAAGLQPAVAATDEILFCANHPNRQTNLRCNRCGKPICSRCARRTPVGYRCRKCVYEQQEVFYNATILHYLLAAIISFPLGLVGGYFANALGLWVIFLAAGAGTLIGRIVFRLIGRRRGRWLPHLVAAILILGAVGGTLPSLLLVLITSRGVLEGLGIGIAGMFISSLLWPVIFAVIAAGAAYYQMR